MCTAQYQSVFVLSESNEKEKNGRKKWKKGDRQHNEIINFYVIFNDARGKSVKKSVWIFEKFPNEINLSINIIFTRLPNLK